MSDNDQNSINWGGLAKGIMAGAAIAAGVEMILPGTFQYVMDFFSGTGATAPAIDPAMINSIGYVIEKIAGFTIAGMGLSYLFSEGSGSDRNENADRHAGQYTEAKEAFAVREDMRKMQAVMMARMKAAGHEPAMAAGGPQVG